MSRRRTPKKQAGGAAPGDGSKLGHLSDAELIREFAQELARRRAQRGELNLDAMESFAEDAQREIGQETVAATIAALPPENTTPKPCPKCGRPVPVKARNRPRHILTVAGEVRLSRNYHHCPSCEFGFYPRDRELNLPESGEVSDAMERRILDFGVNDTFESVAERWRIHFPTSISANLVRLVVDRAGARCESAVSDENLQLASRARPAEPASMLTVATDGSMLLTREESWREVKVGVIARGGFIPPGEERKRRRVADARYVAVLGGQTDFKRALAAALSAERADEVETVAWLGDGARENWTLAGELCPLAIQILDIPHAVHWGMKRAGQRWSVQRARRMVRLRAVYRTAGPVHFHRALRDGLVLPAARSHRTQPNSPRRVKHQLTPSRVSPLNRVASK
jgi:hypothetical protein